MWETYCLFGGKGSVVEPFMAAMEMIHTYSLMTKVISQWNENGLKTEEDVKTYLENLEFSFARYKEVLHTLGINRGVTKAEREIIDSWFDRMGFDMNRVLDCLLYTSRCV